jgi:hypothetical protein
MRRWVITTGKGDVYVTLSRSESEAVTDFHKKFPALAIASVIEATEF